MYIFRYILILSASTFASSVNESSVNASSMNDSSVNASSMSYDLRKEIQQIIQNETKILQQEIQELRLEMQRISGK